MAHGKDDHPPARVTKQSRCIEIFMHMNDMSGNDVTIICCTRPAALSIRKVAENAYGSSEILLSRTPHLYFHIKDDWNCNCAGGVSTSPIAWAT
jgi:hypothetical protein